MDTERRFCLIASCSLGLGVLLGIATLFTMFFGELDDAIPPDIVIILFLASVGLLALGCHCLDRHDGFKHTLRSKSL